MGRQQVVTVTLNPSMDKTVLLPSLQVGGLNRAEEIRLDPGGKGINVARILQSFQVRVTAVGFLAGTLGSRIRRELEGIGIRTEFVEVAGETRTNMKLVDTWKRVTTEINEPGFDIAPEALKALNQNLEALLAETEVMVLGGSLPKGVDTQIYYDYIRMAHRFGVKTILDADGEALAAGIEAIPYAVKPNQFELEQLVGAKLETDRDIVEAGRSLLNRGIRVVLVSMGAQGAIVMNETETYRVRPFPIEALSTVGAGDSMVAVMAHALLVDRPLPELARWSAAAGTLTASKPGTQVSTFEEIERHVNQVQLQAL
ncbi:1-phosphofructokinase [Paenibacillus sp. tmac-D7]|uniref:1-phosphofructokinase n=1 Tax=Paenibacillus sp. tmac-D7 TaxID=2591462 RepID=UPI001143B7FF|nr:1-phosphofructokinase [Paenibacillus sp. tmac-D7]